MSDFAYKLRYEPPHLTQSERPEIYCVIPGELFPGFVTEVSAHVKGEKSAFLRFYQGYLGGKMPFEMLEERFGFAGCAYIKHVGGDAEIRFPMKYEYAWHLCATISAVLRLAMHGHVQEELPEQTVVLYARTELEMHGHSIWGEVSPQMCRWIKAQHRRLDDSVVRAMRSVWREVCQHGLEEYERDCRARLEKDGRFMFECFGDACDVGIYPDHGADDLENRGTRFSCHNLDNQAQQLTLIAGLASMLTIRG
jgi:hypothetical protein